MAEAALHNETVAGVRQLRELLADVPWLASLSTTERDGLLEMSERRTLASREWLYIVITGGLRLVRAAGDGREATIRCVERGGTLGGAEHGVARGSLSLFHSAEALKRCQVLALPTAACRDVLDNHPSCRAEYLGRLAMELTERLEDLALLTKADAMSRLVSFLLSQLPRSSRPGPRVVRLSVPRCWLAEQLAMAPETLSRLLARLREQGAIDADRRRLVILDEGKLRRLLLEAG